ncbi:hypothetical protein [Deinococcus sp.]|uniref:hypothetical protein n=1 Tax=Deinococcus sp. TaxID=47478 RepID=UPI002869ABBA|nr:hypothetical protein [Deinococcus sp.]
MTLVPMNALKIAVSTVTTARLSPALAQSMTLWGGMGTDAYFVPTATLGLSARVGQLGGAQVSVRGTAGLGVLPIPDATGPLTLLAADVLFSGATGPLNAHGGPGVAFVPGVSAVLVGVAGGVQGRFGQGAWGWFAEGKLRYAFSTAGGCGLVLPGADLGVRYRF